jgi:hypothetical protein
MRGGIMTKSKTTLAIVFGGIMLGGSAFADESSMPWTQNPEQYAPDGLSAYGEDLSRLHQEQDTIPAEPTLIAAGDGKSRPWVENPEAYAPDGLSAYGGNYRLPERVAERSDRDMTIARR